MKFSQMPYKRPVLEEVRETLGVLIGAFESAPSPEAALEAYRAADAFAAEAGTMGAIAYIRNTLDTEDEFYNAEIEYIYETEPQLKETTQRLEKALLASLHRAFLEGEFGSLMFKNIEISLKTFSPEIISELQQEKKLMHAYNKLIASAQIDFDGKTLTLAQLAPYHQSPEREIRYNSMLVRSAWFLANADELDGLFDKLVEVRTAMARKLGYESFTELGYLRMCRNCYDKGMVEKFREGVLRHIVPVASRLKAEQAARIGVPALTVYDDPYTFRTGNPIPRGDPEKIFAHGREMYRCLSPETHEFFEFMLENELFDVLARKGKSSGGYCYHLTSQKSPFVFANFNGTAGDIDVLTHEMGHAYAAYAARDIFPSDNQSGTYETCEVHSMSMEFFAWPWMEGFFGDQADKYRYSHLSDALTFLPYGAMVDDFQHLVYESPGMTPAQRNECWLELEKNYRPYLDLDFPFYGEGRRWQMQAHIFENPFYYIDYCLAQTVALSFLAADAQNHGDAWARYQKFISYAGKKTFTELVDAAGLRSPFEPDALAVVSAAAVKWLENAPKVE